MHADRTEGAQAEARGVLAKAIRAELVAVPAAEGGEFAGVDAVGLVLPQGVGRAHEAFGEEGIEHVNHEARGREAPRPREVIAAGRFHINGGAGGQQRNQPSFAGASGGQVEFMQDRAVGLLHADARGG